MTIIRGILLILLAATIVIGIDYVIRPPVEVLEEYCDEYCLTQGCAREAHYVTVKGVTTEVWGRPVSSVLASFTQLVFGPCPKHEWVSYHGGAIKYQSGILHSLLGETNISFSGNRKWPNVQLVTAGKFDSLRHVFSDLQRKNRSTLERLLRLILALQRSDMEFDAIEFNNAIQDYSMGVRKGPLSGYLGEMEARLASFTPQVK